jgi:hypothetical protein
MATEEDVIALQNTFYVPEQENTFYREHILHTREHILHTREHILHTRM